jgi:hypothetical protein
MGTEVLQFPYFINVGTAKCQTSHLELFSGQQLKAYEIWHWSVHTMRYVNPRTPVPVISSYALKS